MQLPTVPRAKQLAEVLALIAHADGELLQREVDETDYALRNALIWHAAVLAMQQGYAVGIRFDPADPSWPVIFIELPTGQISWHLPQHGTVWDGHTRDEKYSRIFAFIDSQHGA